MKIYHITKTRIGSPGYLYEGYATELGLLRMGASIQNNGGSYAPSEEGEAIAKILEKGDLVQDPNSYKIFWEARCLGSNFRYCPGIAFFSQQEMDRFKKGLPSK